jgi:hypothetical protein
MELCLAGSKNIPLRTISGQQAVNAFPKSPFCSIRHWYLLLYRYKPVGDAFWYRGMVNFSRGTSRCDTDYTLSFCTLNCYCGHWYNIIIDISRAAFLILNQQTDFNILLLHGAPYIFKYFDSIANCGKWLSVSTLMVCQADFMLRTKFAWSLFFHIIKKRETFGNITKIMATENFMYNRELARHTRIVECGTKAFELQQNAFEVCIKRSFLDITLAVELIHYHQKKWCHL